MSVLPWTTMAPSASISRGPSTAPAGSGPFIARSPATMTTSGFSRLMALRTASSATLTPWTSDSTAIRALIGGPPGPRLAASPKDALGRDDEAQGCLAGDLTVDARDPAGAAEAGAELLHRDLEPER